MGAQPRETSSVVVAYQQTESFEQLEPSSTTMATYCEGCTCGRAQAAQNGIVNGVAEDPSPDAFGQTRSFTAPKGEEEETEGIEPAVPLRSKNWWNNPQDGKSLAS